MQYSQTTSVAVDALRQTVSHSAQAIGRNITSFNRRRRRRQMRAEQTCFEVIWGWISFTPEAGSELAIVPRRQVGFIKPFVSAEVSAAHSSNNYSMDTRERERE